MKKFLIAPLVLLSLMNSAHADKGPILWHEGVEVSQESQKAIILHNAVEEVLILGTEMKANKKIEILEFIPFPSEPTVSLATGALVRGDRKTHKEEGPRLSIQQHRQGRWGNRVGPGRDPSLGEDRPARCHCDQDQRHRSVLQMAGRVL